MELTNPITADGSQTVARTPGRRYSFQAQGDFDGGTLKLEWSFSGTTWSENFGTDDNPVKISLTADGGAEFVAPSGQLRVTLSGSGSPSIEAYFNEL